MWIVFQPFLFELIVFSCQTDGLLHSGQILIPLARLSVRSAAAAGGSSSVSVPAAVFSTLLRVRHAGPHCHHGCCVQQGKD